MLKGLGSWEERLGLKVSRPVLKVDRRLGIPLPEVFDHFIHLEQATRSLLLKVFLVPVVWNVIGQSPHLELFLFLFLP